jgi:hypothetical protein
LGNNQPEVIFNTNGNGLGYGLGLGFSLINKENTKSTENASFTMRVMYLWGDQSSFVKRGSIKVDPSGPITYEYGQTATSMLLIQMGVTLWTNHK